MCSNTFGGIINPHSLLTIDFQNDFTFLVLMAEGSRKKAFVYPTVLCGYIRQKKAHWALK